MTAYEGVGQALTFLQEYFALAWVFACGMCHITVMFKTLHLFYLKGEDLKTVSIEVALTF